MELNVLIDHIKRRSREIHKELGNGLLESAYKIVLADVLKKDGLQIEQEVWLDLKYKELEIRRAYRIDLLVEGKIVVELKAVSMLNDSHHRQLTSYMRLGQFPAGILLNFGCANIFDQTHVWHLNNLKK